MSAPLWKKLLLAAVPLVLGAGGDSFTGSVHWLRPQPEVRTMQFNRGSTSSREASDVTIGCSASRYRGLWPR